LHSQGRWLYLVLQFSNHIVVKDLQESQEKLPGKEMKGVTVEASSYHKIYSLRETSILGESSSTCINILYSKYSTKTSCTLDILRIERGPKSLETFPLIALQVKLVALEVFKDNTIIGLSSKQQIIILSSSSRQDSLRVLHQYKLIETANTLLRNPTSGCEILLTRDGIFIGN
jgi:hypothetical protein